MILRLFFYTVIFVVRFVVRTQFAMGRGNFIAFQYLEMNDDKIFDGHHNAFDSVTYLDAILSFVNTPFVRARAPP